MDVYRFYADAVIGLVEWVRREHPELELVESFISERDEDIWNDFCAVFSKTKIQHPNKVHSDTPCSNVWSDGIFLDRTLTEATEDMRLIDILKKKLEQIETEEEIKSKLSESERLNPTLIKEISELKNSIELVNVQLELAIRDKAWNAHELLLMQDSISWRVTSPLRRLKSWIRK